MILQMLTFTYIMSERLSIVVPNGTIEKLKAKAEADGYSQSALGRKLLLDGLKKSATVEAVLNHEEIAIILNRKDR